MAHSHKYMIPALKAAFRAWHERTVLAVKIYPTYTLYGVTFEILGADGRFLRGQLTTMSIDVTAFVRDTVYDVPFHAQAFPRAAGNVWVEERFLGGTMGPAFETKAELWAHHLFEPLARWLAEEYDPATYLEFRAWVEGGRLHKEVTLREEEPTQPPEGLFLHWGCLGLEHAFYKKLIARADEVEALGTLVLEGLSVDEILWVRAAELLDGVRCCTQVSGLDDEQFKAVMGTKVYPADFSPEQMAIGRRLVAERMRPNMGRMIP